MGRSFAAATHQMAQTNPILRANTSFEANGLQYSVEWRGKHLVHREACRNSRGAVIAEREVTVRFLLGSGTRGCTFLFGDDGYLFQSPISWYAQKKIWDLSPGYRQQNLHFDRPISNQCLACHANHVVPVEQSENRYQEPLFPQGHAIGCERCHGPGELHVRRREDPGEWSGDFDETIVNPARLEPALREAVCQQCHLQGQSLVMRPGRQAFDFRPGLPLQLFQTVFVWRPGYAPNQKAVGQVEQMYSSKCFRDSRGRLGCISCHDPHEQPRPETRVAHFRDRCLRCHGEKSPCSLPLEVRRKENRDDNCAACHMPRLETDVAHIAATDHRLLRRPESDGSPFKPPPPPPGEALVIAFHHDLTDPTDPEPARALGVALIHLAAEKNPPEAIKRQLVDQAMPLLERSPDDAEALAARAKGLSLQGSLSESLAMYEMALAKAPLREAALGGAAEMAEKLGRTAVALDYWRRAEQASPERWLPHYQVARLRADAQEWMGSLEESQKALQFNPFSIEARVVQVRCLLALGKKDQARAAFETILALKPADAPNLQRWFAERIR
jgi:predicted CXXCH cytochrome family protein